MSQMRRFVRAQIGRAIRWHERRIAGRFRHDLAVAAIFRQEAPFLDEWLAFHAGVGVSHFYLYNNFSTDAYRAALAPWLARGMVTLTDWPVRVGQLSAYRHALRRARRDCRWLALIDIDEFLFSPATIDVRAILADYADLPGVFVWQLFFGSSGHDVRPDLPVTEAYLQRGDRHTGKSIVNPRQVYKVGIHTSKYWSGTAADTAGRTEFLGEQPVLDVLRINHYWSRSLQDLRDKIGRGDASTPMPRTEATHLAIERTLNAVRDETILPVARAIRDGRGVKLSNVGPGT